MFRLRRWQRCMARASRGVLAAVLPGLLALLGAPLARAVMIEGYPSATSVVQGDTLGLHIRTVLDYHVQVEDALDAAHVLYVSPTLQGQWHVVPDSAYANGCGWPVALEIPIGRDWPSGMYDARLVSEFYADTSFTSFVVLEDDPGSTSNILFQCATNTYQAYNSWGGKSLYDNSSSGGQRAHRVSYDRPYSAGQHHGRGEFPLWEAPLAGWLRDEGITVEFCSNVDLELDPGLLQRYDLFMSVGHDEYWSKAMLDQVEAHRDAGGNLAFFSGNTAYWAVRLGENARRLVCYKDYRLDPYYELGLLDEVTDLWRAYPLERPEAALLGVMYEVGNWCFRECGAPLRPLLATHWTTRGLGLEPFEPLGAQVVGYEWDQWIAGISPPGTQRVFESPVENYLGENRVAHATYYERPAGTSGPPLCRVFAAGTVQWSWGVGGAAAQPRLQASTRRIIGCLRAPQRLSTARETLFRADATALGLGAGALLWLHGRTAPLAEQGGAGIRMHDDGQWPDEQAGDQVYAAAVSFPAGTWVTVEYWYETTALCSPEFFSAWIEDPDSMVEGRAALSIDVLERCPVALAAGEQPPGATGDDPRTAGEADRPRLTVRRIARGVHLEVELPARLVGAPLSASLHDAGGRLVQQLAPRRAARRWQRLVWNGRDGGGRRAPRGVYFARIRIGARALVEKLVWIE